MVHEGPAHHDEKPIDLSLRIVNRYYRQRYTSGGVQVSDTLERSRIERLGEITTELDECDSVSEVYEHAVAATERLVEFDAGIVCTVEDGVFEPRAVNVDHLVPGEPLSVDDGLAGKTARNGESYVIDDLEAASEAEPTSNAFRSVLSVPVGDDPAGVLQLHAVAPGAFSATDRTLVELLAGHVENAVERVEYRSALGRERDQFVALFENVPDPAIRYGIEGGEPVVDAVNSAFVRVFGYDPPETLDRPVVELLVPEGELDPPERTTSAYHDIEVRRETTTGARPFLLRNVPVSPTSDAVRGYLIYTDLAALKQRERELERRNERLDQFASMVSHDLRTPLNLARGHVDLARQERDLARLDEVERAHERMDELIGGFLKLARAGTGVETTTRVALADVAAEAWASVRTEDATLHVETERTVEADPDRLRQLLENLFRNAVEHGSTSSQTAPGDAVEHGSTSSQTASGNAVEYDSGDVTVRVDDRPNGFLVADDGPGIPPSERKAVFESGYTDDSENTGLGLAIVDQITDDHGWHVELTESPDGGAAFEFTTDDHTVPGGTVPGDTDVEGFE